MNLYRRIPTKIRKSASTFIKAGLVIAIAIVLFDWIGKQYNIKGQVETISNEVWLGTATTVIVTYFQWYKSQEKEAVEAVEKQIITNRKLVGNLETRISSVMLQVSGFKSDLDELSKAMQATDRRNLELDEKIDQYRYQVLSERLEIVFKVYEELCNIHSTINYVRGMQQSGSADNIRAIANEIQAKKTEFEPKLKQNQSTHDPLNDDDTRNDS